MTTNASTTTRRSDSRASTSLGSGLHTLALLASDDSAPSSYFAQLPTSSQHSSCKLFDDRGYLTPGLSSVVSAGGVNFSLETSASVCMSVDYSRQRSISDSVNNAGLANRVPSGFFSNERKNAVPDETTTIARHKLISFPSVLLPPVLQALVTAHQTLAERLRQIAPNRQSLAGSGDTSGFRTTSLPAILEQRSVGVTYQPDYHPTQLRALRDFVMHPLPPTTPSTLFHAVVTITEPLDDLGMRSHKRSLSGGLGTSTIFVTRYTLGLLPTDRGPQGNIRGLSSGGDSQGFPLLHAARSTTTATPYFALALVEADTTLPRAARCALSYVGKLRGTADGKQFVLYDSGVRPRPTGAQAWELGGQMAAALGALRGSRAATEVGATAMPDSRSTTQTTTMAARPHSAVTTTLKKSSAYSAAAVPARDTIAPSDDSDEEDRDDACDSSEQVRSRLLHHEATPTAMRGRSAVRPAGGPTVATTGSRSSPGPLPFVNRVDSASREPSAGRALSPTNQGTSSTLPTAKPRPPSAAFPRQVLGGTGLKSPPVLRYSRTLGDSKNPAPLRRGGRKRRSDLIGLTTLTHKLRHMVSGDSSTAASSAAGPSAATGAFHLSRLSRGGSARLLTDTSIPLSDGPVPVRCQLACIVVPAAAAPSVPLSAAPSPGHAKRASISPLQWFGASSPSSVAPVPMMQATLPPPAPAQGGIIVSVPALRLRSQYRDPAHGARDDAPLTPTARGGEGASTPLSPTLAAPASGGSHMLVSPFARALDRARARSRSPATNSPASHARTGAATHSVVLPGPAASADAVTKGIVVRMAASELMPVRWTDSSSGSGAAAEGLPAATRTVLDSKAVTSDDRLVLLRPKPLPGGVADAGSAGGCSVSLDGRCSCGCCAAPRDGTHSLSQPPVLSIDLQSQWAEPSAERAPGRSAGGRPEPAGGGKSVTVLRVTFAHPMSPVQALAAAIVHYETVVRQQGARAK